MEERYLKFDQKYLLKHRLDGEDRELLQFLMLFSRNKKVVKREFREKEFFWFDYKKFLENFPAIGFTSEETLRRRFEKFREIGLIDREIHRPIEKNIKGTYIFFRILDDFYKIYSSEKWGDNKDSLNINNNKNNNLILTPYTKSGMGDKYIVELERENKIILNLYYEKFLNEDEKRAVDETALKRARYDMPDVMDNVIFTISRTKYRYLVLGDMIKKL